MVKLVYTFSILLLIAAGVLFVLCGSQWSGSISSIEQTTPFNIAEKFHQVNSENNQQVLSQLVIQAQTFALHLNPPSPPKPKTVTVSQPALEPVAKTPVQVSEGPKPKFELIAISYYRFSPVKSLALISEPGSGARWIKQGDVVGHFVVDSIKKGSLVYRDGDQLCEMTADKKISVLNLHEKNTTVVANDTSIASNGAGVSPSRNSIAHKPDTKTTKQLLRLGPKRPQAQQVKFDN